MSALLGVYILASQDGTEWSFPIGDIPADSISEGVRLDTAVRMTISSRSGQVLTAAEMTQALLAGDISMAVE